MGYPAKPEPAHASSGANRKSIVDVVPLALVRAREAAMLPFRNLLRRYDLTEPQFRVLRTVAELTGVELTELSRKTALLMPSLSRISRELERRGYLQRGPDPADMRRTVVKLTERGDRLVDLVLPDYGRVQAAIKRTMGAGKLKQLQALLLEFETKLAYLEFDFNDEPYQHSTDVSSVAPPSKRGRSPRGG